MKRRLIYKASSQMCDLSKDRVHLNLSYGEWEKLRHLVTFSSFYIENKRWKRKAENIQRMFEHCKDLPPMWDETD